MSSKACGRVSIRVTNENTAMCVLRSLAQDHPRSTEHDLCDPHTLCPGSCGRERCWELSLWVLLCEDGHQRQARVWQVLKQRLAAPRREGTYGHPYVTGARLDSFSWGEKGMRRKVLKTQLFSSWHNIWFQNGCGNQVWLMSWAPQSCCLPWPPASLPDLTLPLHRESSSYQTERGQEGNGAIGFPLPTLLCVCSGGSLLEWMTLLFLWCYSKCCTIYQQCFLIT